MKKNLQLIVLCMLVCLLSTADSMAQMALHKPSESVTNLEKEFSAIKSDWIFMIPPGEVSDFGFTTLEEAAKAEAGPFIELYHIYNTRDGKTEISQTGEYLIPMILEGQARVFLKLAYFEKRYQIVSVGEMTLAMDASPIILQSMNAQGSRPIWIQHLNHNADFIATISQSIIDEDILITPIFTAERAGILSPARVSQVLEQLSSLPYTLD